MCLDLSCTYLAHHELESVVVVIIITIIIIMPCVISRRFQRDLQGAVDFIQAPGPLKEAVKKLYRTHCKETLDTASIDEEVLSEYDRQREFLEKNVDTLKHKLHAEMHKHKAANSTAMLVSCFKIGQPD